MRLIDADALGIGEANRDVFTVHEYADGWNSAIKMIENAPTIDAEPVRHGHWIEVSTTKRDRIFKCSVCRNVLDFDGVNAGRGDANYCPHCGAKMDEEDNT